MKFLVLVSTLLLSVSAFGARYIVYLEKSQIQNLTQIESLFENPKSSIEIEKSLPHLQAFIIESKDENLQLQAPGAFLEKEILHPAPRVIESRKSQLFNVETANPWGVTAVNAKKAWTLSKKGKGARVLVLDSGADINHPALSGQIEIVKNLVTDERPSKSVEDDVGHGTHVAGTIAAKEATNGFSGIAPGAKLLIGKVCMPNGCTSADTIAGIEWGISQKVDVINLSLGDTVQTEAEKKAIAKAEAAGVLVVAASGNDGIEGIMYPAAYPTAIAVGAVGEDLKRAKFSQWGPELDIMAPGVGIVSSVPTASGKAYASYSGTSMAAPHATGVVALVKATKKALKPAQVRDLIKKTATSLGGDAAHYGAGLINAEKAVTKASQM